MAYKSSTRMGRVKPLTARQAADLESLLRKHIVIGMSPEDGQKLQDALVRTATRLPEAEKE